jgi:hypothetical protein
MLSLSYLLFIVIQPTDDTTENCVKFQFHEQIKTILLRYFSNLKMYDVSITVHAYVKRRVRHILFPDSIILIPRIRYRYRECYSSVHAI